MNFVLWATEYISSVFIDIFGEPIFTLLATISPYISSFLLTKGDLVAETFFSDFLSQLNPTLEAVFESFLELLFEYKLPGFSFLIYSIGGLLVDAILWWVKIIFSGLFLLLEFTELSLIWLIQGCFNLISWITWKFAQLLYGIMVNIIQITWNYMALRAFPPVVSMKLYRRLDPVNSHTGFPVTLIQFFIVICIVIMAGRAIKNFIAKRRKARVINCITCKTSTGKLMKIFSYKKITVRQCIECYTKISDHLKKDKRRECIVCFENASVNTWTSCCGQPLDRKCNKKLVKGCPNCRYKEYRLIKRPLWADRAFEILEE